jgi:hypothetical protein
MFKKQNRTNIFFLALLVAAIGALFLVDPLSNFLYVFKPIQYVLYPYRFLFVVTFAGSLVAGYLARKNFLFSVLIITSSVIFGLPFTKPYIEIFPFPQTFFDQPQMLGYAIPTKKTMGTAEFLPKSADITFLVNEEKKYMESGVLPQPVIIPAADGTVTSVTKKQQSLMTNVSIKNPTSITISTFFYPGWHATINAKPLTIYADSVGRITAPIPPGNHKIAFSFGRSPVENVGIIISILGIVFFLGSIKKIQTRSIQS